MDWAKTPSSPDEKHLSFEIWCDLYKRFDIIVNDFGENLLGYNKIIQK